MNYLLSLLYITLLSFVSCQTICKSSQTGFICGGVEVEYGSLSYCVAVTGSIPDDSPCIALYGYPSGVKVCSTTDKPINLGTYTDRWFTGQEQDLATRRQACVTTLGNSDGFIHLNTSCCAVFNTGKYCVTPQCLCPRPCTEVQTVTIDFIVRPTSISQCFEDCTSCLNMETGAHTEEYCNLVAGTPTQVSGTYYAKLDNPNCCTVLTGNSGTSGAPSLQTSRTPTGTPVIVSSTSGSNSRVPVAVSQSSPPSITPLPSATSSQMKALPPIPCPQSPIDSGKIVLCSETETLINEDLVRSNQNVVVNKGALVVINGDFRITNSNFTFYHGSRLVIYNENGIFISGYMSYIFDLNAYMSSANKREVLALESDLIVYKGQGSSTISLQTSLVNTADCDVSYNIYDRANDDGTRSYGIRAQLGSECVSNEKDKDSEDRLESGELIGIGIGIGVGATLIIIIIIAVLVGIFGYLFWRKVVMKRKLHRANAKTQWGMPGETYTAGDL
eukprot:TRINITY_DN294_c0_g1_i1.p1 TRINITY_DN294_c0_g1~~TRINITY_DN294_c0_g1_i1.p1  ORF type:complete len:502 (-),score=47.96 TRINITY_DN294_c0_g1_i1:104-1609(-)